MLKLLEWSGLTFQYYFFTSKYKYILDILRL
ncbi:protein of unknown function [Ruminococcaceae bacterium BL-6]|nr:protein of unknown function [Ruminococcaceae bacterium BL-6]